MAEQQPVRIPGRYMRREEMKLRLLLSSVAVGGLIAAGLGVAGSAVAAPPQTCSGTFDSPGMLSGSYSNVVVSGFCGVSGPTTISGHLVLRPNSTLAAVFAGANLTVNGNVDVQRGATLLAGCNPFGFTCIDNEAGFSSTHITGNLIQTQALGVVLHGDTIDGNVVENGGGGGVNCDPSGVFVAFDSPVFSVYDGSRIGGNITVTGRQSCWLGIAHSQIGGSVHLLHNQLADPDAIEVIDNSIGGNIVCEQNSMVWDSADITEALYPRDWEPNTVGGTRVGQCVVAPPIDSPEGVSPGAF
jgi:hypothetical protein